MEPIATPSALTAIAGPMKDWPLWLFTATALTLRRVGVTPELVGKKFGYEIKRSHGVDFIVRTNSVDVENIEWMSDSIFLDELFRSNLSAKDCIVDLGSHIGSFALIGVFHTGCRAVCFEPDGESFRISRANAHLNRLAGLVDFHMTAVGGIDGKAVLYQCHENWGHTIFAKSGPNNRLTGIKREVPILSLDSVLKRVPPSEHLFIKFNIEGAEFQMFENAISHVLQRVNVFVGEVHYYLGHDDFGLCLERLETSGFATDLIPFADDRAILVARRR
jgi:FkbM family methyltransferase